MSMLLLLLLDGEACLLPFGLVLAFMLASSPSSPILLPPSPIVEAFNFNLHRFLFDFVLIERVVE